MRLLLLISIILMSNIDIFAQQIPVKVSASENNLVVVEEKVPAVIKIYPVPVLEGRFTITSDKPFIFIRMTNIIGQEVISERFYYPRSRSEVTFPNSEKGIYLITIELEDNSKVVKKILVDTSR